MPTPERLTALRASGLLESPQHEAFARIVRHAAELLHAPVALITLVSGDRESIVALHDAVGEMANDRRTMLAERFCHEVVRGGAQVLIADASRHRRASNIAISPEAVGVAAFAGMPLRAARGEILGAIAFADSVCRAWTDHELEMLSDLAAATVTEVELRITTRRLREREQQLADLLDQTDDLVCVTDGDGRITYVNQAWRRTLGYTQPQAQGLHPVDLVAPEHQGRYREICEKLARGEPVADIEMVLVGRDGVRHVVRGGASPTTQDDSVIATRMVFRDVTRERQNEALGARLVSTIEATTDLVAIATREGHLVYLNRAGKSLIGLAEDVDVTVVRTVDLYPDEEFDRLTREMIPQALRAGVWEGETLLLAKGGERIPVSQVLVAHPSLREGDPSPYFISVLMRDLRGRVRDEAKLREREARFRSILQSVRAAAVVIDPHGRVVFANDYLLECTGLSREDAEGAPWLGRFVPETDGTLLSPEAIARGDVPSHYETALLARGGDRRVIAWDSVVLRTDDGRVAGVASIGQDVTDRRRVEELKDQVIAIVGHELRSPIGAVRGGLQVLGRRLQGLGEQEQQLFEMAVRNTDRLLKLVNDLLDYERLDAGVVALDRSLVTGAALLEQAREVVAVAADAAGVQLELKPGASEVWADPNRIVQVLVNLLSNAIKFSPPKGIVSVSVSEDEDEVVFRVRDRGRGIPVDKLESVFDRFTQVHGADAKRGSGLGLAIARAIVRQHGGRIWVESTVGRGSTFAFALPLAELALVSAGTIRRV